MSSTTESAMTDATHPLEIVDDIQRRLGEAADLAFMIEELAYDKDNAESHPLWAGLAVLGRHIGELCTDANERISKLYEERIAKIFKKGGA